LVFDRYDRFATLFLDLERPVFYVSLHVFIIKSTADEALSVEDGIFGIRMKGVFGGISDTEGRIQHNSVGFPTKGNSQAFLVAK
jgi:hypothetical protein